MEHHRLGAFVDAVIAIIITIMVLELKVPHEATFHALIEMGPIFLSYVLSFIYLGIYWNNHHHFYQLARRVNGAVLWANIHLLFWLSLVPFATAWMGENHFAAAPMAVYGAVLLMSAVSYYLMQLVVIRMLGRDSDFARAVGKDWKGKASPFLYAAGIASAFVNPWLSGAFYVFVAGMWLVPDSRMEKAIIAKEA